VFLMSVGVGRGLPAGVAGRRDEIRQRERDRHGANGRERVVRADGGRPWSSQSFVKTERQFLRAQCSEPTKPLPPDWPDFTQFCLPLVSTISTASIDRVRTAPCHVALWTPSRRLTLACLSNATLSVDWSGGASFVVD
jgi:hypothetical protein